MPPEQARPPRIIAPADHAAALHPTGLGHVTIARRYGACDWREDRVPVADLPDAVRHLEGEADVYASQNRFHGPRRIVRLAELCANFVDLDYYKSELAGAHPRHVLDLAYEVLVLRQAWRHLTKDRQKAVA